MGQGNNKPLLIAVVSLGVLVIGLGTALAIVLVSGPEASPIARPPQNDVAAGDSSNEQKAQEPKEETALKAATLEDKKMMGIPDVSNIEILSRDESGRPTSYRLLKGKEYQDSDVDGLTDADEARFGTDKDSVDTDGDGLSDWQELGSGQDPKVKNDYDSKK